MTLRSKILHIIVLTSFALGFSACGQGVADGAISPDASTPVDANATDVNFSFTLQLQMDADNNAYDTTLSLPGTYDLPISVSSDGDLSFRANEFPELAFRVCTEDSAATDCDGHSDVLGYDFDLIVDSCGYYQTDSSCGENDDTRYSGTLSDSGDISIPFVSLRTRVIKVSDGGASSIDATDSGEITFDRLIVNLTTGTVSAGNLTGTGTPTDGTNAVLIAGATLSENATELGTVSFIGAATGSFDQDLNEITQ